MFTKSNTVTDSVTLVKLGKTILSHVNSSWDFFKSVKDASSVNIENLSNNHRIIQEYS